MPSYFDKKKLLEDNNDLFISSYDKTLDNGSLSQIIDAKRSYKSAEAAGDTEAMEKANAKANSIRKNAGYYDGGNDGSEYNRVYKDYETSRPSAYKSKYSDEKEKAISLISDREDFGYDPESDPLYETYRQIYLALGDDAYDRALSKNALRTGGMVSTSAQSAAMQAKNEYNSMLAAKVPELYELAYKKYRDDTDELYNRLDAYTKLDEDEYSKYRDTVKDFENDRDYFYKVDSNYLKSLYDMYTDETDLEYKLAKDEADNKRKDEEAAYERERNAVKDSQWNSEFEYKKLYDSNKLNADKLDTVVNLAKAIYGKTPISSASVKSLLSILGL